jgi:hypothetical protein
MAVSRLLALALALGCVLCARNPKESKDERKSHRLEMVGLAIRRVPEDRTIGVEGKVRNCGTHSERGLQLIFTVIAPSGEEVSRQRGLVDSDPFEPGDEFEFHWQMKDQGRAVEMRIAAQDRQGRIIDINNPGPYTIE